MENTQETVDADDSEQWEWRSGKGMGDFCFPDDTFKNIFLPPRVSQWVVKSDSSRAQTVMIQIPLHHLLAQCPWESFLYLSNTCIAINMCQTQFLALFNLLLLKYKWHTMLH